MNHRLPRRALTALALVFLCLTACGCAFIFAPEALYSLPMLPAQYTGLNSDISAILESGAEYAAPVSGANIQPVQLVDLDGDGSEEALAFFREADSEKPLKIHIFSDHSGAYEQIGVIEGSGASIYSVVYSDLDNDGRTELVVGWRVSADLQVLSVYSLRGGQAQELIRTPYVKYTVSDLERDGLQEITVFHADSEGGGVADYYGWQDAALNFRSTARISMTMAELSQLGRVTKGLLRDEVPALFVTGVAESNVSITDILTVRNGELTNVALSSVTGYSGVIYPFRALYPTDINGDGLTEVPAPTALPQRSEDTLDPLYRVDWLSYDGAGESATVESTYHDNESGWYFRLPEEWLDKIYITRGQTGQDEVAVTFSRRDVPEGENGDFLRIYTITGDSRKYKALWGKRFILSRQAETIYSAELLPGNDGWSLGPTEDEVCTLFSRIITEWLSGDN